MERLVKTKEDEIIKLIKDRDYKSIRHFAQSMDMNGTNVWRNVKGFQPINLNIAFRYAKALHVPIDEIMRLFRPDDVAELNRNIARYKKELEDKRIEEEVLYGKG